MKGIKMLGLTALTALALLALPGIASASPGIITPDSYPATLKAVQTGSPPGSLTTQAAWGGAKCVSPTLSASVTDPSEAVSLPATASENCSFAKSGCQFTLHPVSGSTSGTIDLTGCASFTAVTGGFCQVTVKAKNNLPAEFYNEGAGTSAKIRVRLTAMGLEYSSSNCNPKETTFTNGSYYTEWLVSAEVGGKAAGVKVAEFPGFSVLGSGDFHSDFYSAVIAGEQTTGKVAEKTYKTLDLTTNTGTVKCTTATFLSPYSGLLEDSSELLLTPSFSGCVLSGTVPVTVTLGSGCLYNMTITGVGPYVGNLSTCEVKVAGPGKCVVTIAGQSQAGMTYENLGSGSGATVNAIANLSTLQYQVAGGSECPNKPADGTYNDGKYRGVVSLKVSKVL